MAASNSTPTRHLLPRDRVNMSMALVKFSTRRFGRSAGGLAPIVTPHSEERSMDFIGRLVERIQVDPHHAAVVHAPRQAHQQASDRLLAPVDNERTAERYVEHNLQLVDGHRALGDLYQIDTLD